MQGILASLLWNNSEIPEAVDKLCQTMPGFRDTERAFSAVAEQVRTLVGQELYDQYYTQFLLYTGYEVRAYYAFGLGLRKEIVQALEL